MSYRVTGTWRGREVAVEWDSDTATLAGEPSLWGEIRARVGQRMSVYPSGPDYVLNPKLPGHVFFALVNMVGQLRYEGTPPDLPEGTNAADVIVPRNAVG